MSNVRISNGSPTLERMEARQSEYPKPSACRNLFGPVNHEELNRELLKAVCKSAGRQSLDVNGNCQTVVFVGSQGISEDTHCVGQKTDVSENQTDFAEQCTGQRKRPATDGNVP
ncbi:CDN1B inhibitor, partial [Pedionomus torquatus]|nr:CDN1B inhibitor [Pedionomus torquatus]